MVIVDRKLEFELLKTGMYMVTPRVKHLRQRWGSKQRIKFRERLARMKQSEEEDLWNSIPLLVRGELQESSCC